MNLIVIRNPDDVAFEIIARQHATHFYPDAKLSVLLPVATGEITLLEADAIYVRESESGPYQDFVCICDPAQELLDRVPSIFPGTAEPDEPAMPAEPAEPDKSAESKEMLFSDEYEEDVLFLLSLSIPRLTDQLSRYFDLGLLYICRDREAAGRARKGCYNVYTEAIIEAGGEP